MHTALSYAQKESFRHIDMRTYVLTGIQAHRQIDMQIHWHMQTYLLTYGHTEKQTHIHTDGHTDTQTNRHIDTQIDQIHSSF